MIKYFYNPKVHTFLFALLLAIALFYIAQLDPQLPDLAIFYDYQGYLNVPDGIWRDVIELSLKIGNYNY